MLLTLRMQSCIRRREKSFCHCEETGCSFTSKLHISIEGICRDQRLRNHPGNGKSFLGRQVFTNNGRKAIPGAEV